MSSNSWSIAGLSSAIRSASITARAPSSSSMTQTRMIESFQLA
jgi:hypothetical protein